MLTIKYRDNRGSESIFPGVQHVSFHEGAVTGQREGDSVTFGPNAGWEGPNPVWEGPNPVVFVMNENGATVARYELYPHVGPNMAACQADPEKLAA